MKIIADPILESTLLYLAPGKQLTFHAVGLGANDYVRFELVELTEAPPQPDSFCCAITPAIEIAGVQPLNCPDGRPMRLTQLLPSGRMDGPQGVYFRAVVEAGPTSIVQLFASDTETSGCDRCVCDYPCEITEWLPTGETRCDADTGQFQEREQSNCGTHRWVDVRPLEWVDTGATRCNVTTGVVEVQQADDCGQLRWVTGEPLAWTPTGAERCDDVNVEREERNNCGDTRWVIDRAVTWVETGNKTCQTLSIDDRGPTDFLVREERNDCGKTRWVVDREVTWTPTGATRCDATNVYHEEVSSCCDCEPRWVDDGPLNRTFNGHGFCVGNDYHLVQVDDCNRKTSVLVETNAVYETGETRCNTTTHLVEVKRENRCGVVSWEPTAEICGYCASYPLPGGGFGFVDPSAMPAGAVLAIQACETGGPDVYLLPAAMHNGVGYPFATKPVYGGDGVILGYAVNTSDCAPQIHPVEECDNCNVRPNTPQPPHVYTTDLAVYVRYDEESMCLYEGNSELSDFTDMFVVEVREQGGAAAVGPTTLTVAWTPAGAENFELSYDQNATTTTLDGTPVSNADWAVTFNPDGSLELSRSTNIAAYEVSRIVVQGRFV